MGGSQCLSYHIQIIQLSSDMYMRRFDSDTPVILVESATDDLLTDVFRTTYSNPSDPVVDTKWHEYSNAEIDSALSSFETLDANFADQPLHHALRTLSSAVHRLSTARAELEESRQALLQREASRRARADQLMKELPLSDRDLARRVIQSLFPDDDEDGHAVKRKFSASVSAVLLNSSKLS